MLYQHIYKATPLEKARDANTRILLDGFRELEDILHNDALVRNTLHQLLFLCINMSIEHKTCRLLARMALHHRYYLFHAEVDAPDRKVVGKMVVNEVWVLNKELLAVFILVQHPKRLHLLLMLLPKHRKVVLGHLRHVRLAWR